MNKQVRDGFTLAEVMMAVTVAGMMISSIVLLATQLYKQTVHRSTVLYDVYAFSDVIARNALARVQEKEKEQKPAGEQAIVTTFKEIPKESKLSVFRDIRRETVAHKDGTGESVVAFVLFKEEEKKP